MAGRVYIGKSEGEKHQLDIIWGGNTIIDMLNERRTTKKEIPGE
jgi:hypothetical protein